MKLPLIACLAVLLTGGWLLWGSAAPSEPQVTWRFADRQVVSLGILPYRADEKLKEEFAPLQRYLGHHLQASVTLNIPMDYEALIQLMDYGKVQMAWFGNTLFEQTAKDHGLEILCRPVINGQTRNHGVIVVLESSPFTDLDHLKGRRFAYVDRHSGTGFISPARLLREKGHDPMNFFGEVRFTGNHSTSLDQLRAGQVDGAAVFVDPVASATLLQGLRVLTQTDWIPTDPIVVRSDLPPALKTKLKELFIEMERLPLGPETLQAFRRSRGFERFQAEATTFPATGTTLPGNAPDVPTGVASAVPAPATGSATE